ncbi:MAG: hypothetical protein IKQ49_10360 [Eubacterium sp.]|nr:hypothetical protein [Eubacterium sp.]
MSDFDSNVEVYRKKKQELINTGNVEETNTNVTRVAPVLKEKKQDKYTNAYRKILAADFDTADWISKEAPLRKHRKNINNNYKSLTGRKSGLSSKEKLKRKDEFETRRDLSLKASMALGTFIGSASGMDPDPADESLLKAVEEMDLSKFVYGGMEGKQDVVCDAEFISGFTELMPVLHNATLLYNKLLQGNLETVSPMIMSKLSQMNDMRQAYEDRIRIISSPYYVSLREVDFDKSTKEKLRKGEDEEKRDESLNDYAKTMLRWQESGRKLLTAKKPVVDAAPVEKVVQDDSVLSDNKEYVSDQAVDKVIGKINKKAKDKFKKMVNGHRDELMTYTREWVYSDLDKKTDDQKMLNEVARMKNRLAQELGDKTIKESTRKNIEKVLRHFDRVTAAYSAKKISKEAMQIWLDRCLQHKLNYSREMYLDLVHQGATKNDEVGYYNEAKKIIDPYVKEMSGVIFAQSSFQSTGVYQNEKDSGETNDPAILRARRGCQVDRVNEFTGMGHVSQKSFGSDFMHISGKNADYNDISTRAYISANPKYKSLVLRLFTETIAEFEQKNMRDEIYFKISTDRDRSNGFATDDLTVYLGSNVSVEERKQLLDRFYEKCNNVSKDKGESILDGENMVIAGTKYKDGIALAGEPDIASLLNSNFSNADSKFHSTFSERKKLEKMQGMSTDEIKSKYSFNTFVISMLIQSTFAAGYRLGTKLNKAINTNDPKVREATKKIFRELCFLNGINPENMADIDNQSALG